MCEFCLEKVGYRLKRHLQRHLPWYFGWLLCTWCEKKFLNSKDFQRHQKRTSHKKVVTRKVRSEVCVNSLRRKYFASASIPSGVQKLILDMMEDKFTKVPNIDNQEEVIDLVGTTPTRDEPQESTPTTWVRAYPCQGQDSAEPLEPRRKRQCTLVSHS